MPTRLPLAIAASALVLVAACGGGGGTKTASSTSTSSKSTTSSPSTSTTAAGASDVSCASGSKDAKALESLVPTSVPAGFEVQTDDVGDTGPSDFAKAVSDDGEDDAAQVLKADGFLRGYQRLWVDDNDSELVAFIYEFCDNKGAAAYAKRTDQFDADGSNAFTVPGVTNATGYTGSDDDGTLYAEVNAVAGRYEVAAMADGAGDAVTTADVQALASGLARQLVANTSNAKD